VKRPSDSRSAVDRMSAEFFAHDPSEETCWRAVVLFGRNVASYKFALAKSLLELTSRRDDLLRLDDLAPVYAAHLCAHLKASEKQITASSSQFLDACRSSNAGEISESQLTEATVRLGFQNVIDAFHVVNQADVPIRFFLDERKSAKGIRLTESLLSMAQAATATDLEAEIEARWRLVESAWSLGLTPHALAVQHVPESSMLVMRGGERRVDVTSARSALNGYQKGRCFYCFDGIRITESDAGLADVDHFFPHVLGPELPAVPINGVWNLVLACADCNRGVGGKFACPASTILAGRRRLS
jgi:hypothetical protein